MFVLSNLLFGYMDDSERKKIEFISFNRAYGECYAQIQRDIFSLKDIKKDIYFNKYIVKVNVEKMTRKEILRAKAYAFKIGKTPVELVDGYLVFGDYKRPADAKDLVEKINGEYFNIFAEFKGDKTLIADIEINRTNAKYTIAPYLFEDTFEEYKSKALEEAKVSTFIKETVPDDVKQELKNLRFEKQILENEVRDLKNQLTIKNNIVQVKPLTIKKQKKLKKETYRHFTYYNTKANSTQVFTYKGDLSKVRILKEELLVNPFYVKGKAFKIERIIVSDDDEKYAKVFDKALLISIDDLYLSTKR